MEWGVLYGGAESGVFHCCALTLKRIDITVTLFKEKKDWPKLRDSGFLYFRKASGESRELLDYIDQIHASKA